MIFSEEDLKRLSARERRTLRGAAGTALAAALGMVPVLLLFALLGGALPVFGQAPPVKPTDDMYVLCSGGGTVPKGSLQSFTCEISNDTGYNFLSESPGQFNSFSVELTPTNIQYGGGAYKRAYTINDYNP